MPGILGTTSQVAVRKGVGILKRALLPLMAFGLLVGSLGCPSAGIAQAECRGLLGNQPRLRPDTSESLARMAFPLVLRLDKITAEAAEARGGLTNRAIGHGDVSSVATDLLASIRGDSAATNQVAEALALLMRGEPSGSSAAQATVASDLYEAWALPFAPAAVLVSDPNESFQSRSRAIYALRRYWREERYHLVALAAACSLAARAAGIQRVMGGQRVEAERLFNEDEMEFLEWLTQSLEAGLTQEAWTRLHFEATLSPDNPVTIDLQEALGFNHKKP